MPAKIIKRAKTNTSAEVLNAIRNSANQYYKDYVPVATDDAECIKNIGNIIMDNPALRNQFVDIINRIALVMIKSRVWDNPLRMFTKGMLEFGETVENIFVDIANAHQYDPEDAESTLFKREMPNVHAEYFVMNYQVFYKQTTQDKDLRQAFLSQNGVIDLVTGIVNAMYTAASYDVYQVTKYMLARRLLDGMCQVVNCNGATYAQLVEKVKAASNKFTFLSNKNNLAHVYNATPKENQYILIDADVDAAIDVNVLAAAFHMDKVTFSGHKVLIDGFGNLDNDRLAFLLANNPNYVAIDSTEQAALNAIPMVLVDEDFFMIFDNLFEMYSDTYNEQGLYRNHFLHNWKTFATSAFSNNAAFIPGTPAVSAITVSPATVTLDNGTAAQTAQFNAAVTTSYYAPQSVVWSVDSTAAAAGVTIDSRGLVTIPKTFEDSTITVTATSTFNSSVTDTSTITVGTVI